MWRILIVDDDKDILTMINYFLTTKGYEVSTQVNHKDIIVTINAFKPHLVLLDINLSGADGRKICKQLKNNYSFPVLLFSAMPNLEEHCKSCHADGYIEKPFETKQLIATINKHLPHTDTQKVA